jgi:hypothetical protein
MRKEADFHTEKFSRAYLAAMPKGGKKPVARRPTSWSRRVMTLVDERGWSMADLAKAMGHDGDPSVIEKLQKSVRQGLVENPRGSLISDIADALDVTEQEIRNGVSMSETKRTGFALPTEPSLISVPEFSVRGGAGGGGYSDEEASVDSSGHTITIDSVRARWGIPVPFLREELRLNPSRAHILPVSGDSMESTLFSGDRVIVDLEDQDLSQGGIFALRDDYGKIIIKQVELVRGSRSEPQRIVCTSRNPSYKPFELILDDPVKIIGRVAGRIARL